MNNSHIPHDSASQVTAEEGEVHVDGPGGVAVSLTPDAAEETGRRLIAAATKARQQAGSKE
ncbi:MAG: hypothetical protein H0W74_07930 [Sphingosinicella sp.]|nr:hypothetical protein [Sphingosinicella sp.]